MHASDRGRRDAPLIVALVLAGGLAFGVSPALAGTGYGPLTGQFGEPGSGDGQFNWPGGVAVDNYLASPSLGHVYVADSFNNRVEKFTAAGVYESQFNGSDAPGGPFSRPEGVAVDPHTGDVWVAAGGVVDKFGPEGKYAGVQLTGTCASPGTCPGSVIPFGDAQGVAVDPSSGDVYVTDYSRHVVDKFTSAGAYVLQFPTESSGVGVAVDSEGNVYVAEPVFEGHGERQVQEFSSTGVFKAKFDSGEDVNVAVDPSNGDVYVDVRRGAQAIQVFRAGALIYQFGSLPNNSLGLAVSLNGTIYASEAEAADVKFFAAGATAEKPKTEAAKVEGPFSATLNGELLGGESGYYFAYNTNGRCEGAGKTLEGAATGTKKESATVEGLEPITQYTFCIVATNLYGPEFAPPLKFTTLASPPVVKEPVVSHIGPFEATLEAKVNPEKQDTTCVFEYGETTKYGTTAACESKGDLGEAFGFQPVSLHVEHLEGGTTYYYRVVAENAQSKFEVKPAEGTGEFTTAVARVPAIEAQSASVETGKEAEPRAVTFAAQVNPELQETTSCVFEYGKLGKPYETSAACEPSETFGKLVNTAVGVTAKVNGLVAGVDYHYCVVVEDQTGTSGCKDHVFGPPTVVTGAVGIAPSTTAPIGGEVNPESLETRYYVQYGETETYGQIAPYLPLGTPLPLGVDAGSGEALVALGQNGGPADVALESLTPGASYHYRLVAYNADGTTYGADETVKVLPAPQVGPASVSEVTQESATISTSVNPQGLHTLYKLDVGTSTAYGTPYPGDAGSGSAPVALTFHLSGLHAGDTYHFRLVASNSDGSSSEADQTFTTAATVVEVPLELIKAPSELGLVSFTAKDFPAETGTTTTKGLTNAQKLAKALKACKKKRPKSKRVACEKQAHKRYAPVKKAKK